MSKAGLYSKKVTGLRSTTIFSDGITGQSSLLGLCVEPNVCQTTMSWFLTDEQPSPSALLFAIMDSRPSPPRDRIVYRPAGNTSSSWYLVTHTVCARGSWL